MVPAGRPCSSGPSTRCPRWGRPTLSRTSRSFCRRRTRPGRPRPRPPSVRTLMRLAYPAPSTARCETKKSSSTVPTRPPSAAASPAANSNENGTASAKRCSPSHRCCPRRLKPC
uniref:(northern house mosquito) hypothetical protein n=1 Tax=Culex pipiens TaxID=7175 RepID=A0A8D8AKL6_CULPI